MSLSPSFRIPLLAFFAALLLAACAGTSGPRASLGESWSVRQQAALAEAMLVPAPAAYKIRYFDWVDRDRQREVHAKLYLPPRAAGGAPAPLVVFSHGLGGSREGYSYLGSNWAARGYASLHVQHAGSDSRLWSGSPFEIVARLQSAATEAEALDRVRDLRFALDQVFATPELAGALDPARIVAAGHSYGANTVLLAAGAVFQRPDGRLSYAEPRLAGAIVISAPPFHGEADAEAVVRPIGIPTLHITATGDEIRLPGYQSGYEDRVRVFAATGSPRKALVVFRDGSHSMFTDRLGPGGRELNVQVKGATLDLTLAFLDEVVRGSAGAFGERSAGHGALIARLESTIGDAR
jgi:dienelactone hydrolase